MSNYRYKKFIERETNLQDNLRTYKSYVNQDKFQREVAHWENRSDARINKNAEQEEKAALKRQRENFVDIRRKKLSDLLIQEDEMYHSELMSNQDTPEVCKKRMESELRHLKELKEAERQSLLKRIEDRKFLEENDELRKNDSVYNNIRCHLEMENQMLDKMKEREKEYRQEKAYDVLNKLDYLKKLERESKESALRSQKISSNLQYLNNQAEARQKELEKANLISALEKKKLNEQWKMEEEMERREREEKLEMNKAVNREIEAFNEKEKGRREEEERREKEEDLRRLEENLRKERGVEEVEKKEKERRKEMFKQNQQFLEYKMRQQKESEEYLDKLAAAEASKQQQKQDELWLRSEAARINLLKDVYKDRARAVMSKKNIEEEEKENLRKEREILDEQIRIYNEKLKELRMKELEKHLENNRHLQLQIKEKDNMKRVEMQDEMYRRRMAQLWEENYQKKLEEQRMIHLQKLKELKAKFNVSDE